MDKLTPWNKIKADYLNGVPPRELEKKYGVPKKKIHEKFCKDATVKEKQLIASSIQDEIRSKIEKASSLAIRRLTEILESSETKDADVVAATRAILDVSGLKSQKLETTITELPVIKDDI